MVKQKNLIITPALRSEDSLIAHHFYQMWLDNGINADVIDNNWLKPTLEFIEQARRELCFQAFVAKVNKNVVGSISCQLFAGLYPMPFKPSFRKYGYIWNVFVESANRRQGIGTELTQTAIAYLQSLNCSHAILHASPHGKPVYENLGFVPKNEMILEL